MEIDLKLIDIGNSKGIRLPKSLIEACGFEEIIKAFFQDDKLILSAHKAPRQGWEKIFKTNTIEGECDGDLKDFREFPNDFDNEEWTW